MNRLEKKMCFVPVLFILVPWEVLGTGNLLQPYYVSKLQDSSWLDVYKYQKKISKEKKYVRPHLMSSLKYVNSLEAVIQRSWTDWETVFQ